MKQSQKLLTLVVALLLSACKADGADVSKITQMVLKQSSIQAIGFSGWQKFDGPFQIIGTTTLDKSVKVYARTPSNAWIIVDCAFLDSGGAICFSASQVYSGFFE